MTRVSFHFLERSLTTDPLPIGVIMSQNFLVKPLDSPSYGLSFADLPTVDFHAETEQFLQRNPRKLLWTRTGAVCLPHLLGFSCFYNLEWLIMVGLIALVSSTHCEVSFDYRYHSRRRMLELLSWKLSDDIQEGGGLLLEYGDKKGGSLIRGCVEGCISETNPLKNDL